MPYFPEFCNNKCLSFLGLLKTNIEMVLYLGFSKDINELPWVICAGYPPYKCRVFVAKGLACCPNHELK